MAVQQLTAGQALVKLLVNYRVDTVFGIPGVHTLELYRGLSGSGVRHVLPRHEQGAGFMADGYARATGKPGVCFVITGPGVTNIATAVGQAYADSVPMLLISSTNARASLGQGWGCLHECQDQVLLTQSITAFTAVANSPEDLPGLVARAFAVFNSARPRPVHLSVPIDVLAQAVERDWSAEVNLEQNRPLALDESIRRAANMVVNARRPMMVAGGGAVQAAAQVVQLAQCLAAPVFTTVAGKGIMPRGHALNAGSRLCVPQGQAALAEADAIIAVGTELAETDLWRDCLSRTAPVIRIDIDTAKFSDRHPTAVAVHGDAADALTRMLSILKPVLAVSSYAQERSAALCAQLKADVEQSLAPLQQTHLRVLQTVEAAVNSLPEQSVRVASDMTQLAYSANYLMQSPGTRGWLHPVGFGTLGYGVPAGMGAQIARPQDPVLVLVGDGGIMYTLTELATAQEEVQGSLVVMLWNNQALGQIRDDMLALHIEPIGVLPRAPDFCALARAMGVHAVRPASLQALQHELLQGLTRKGVTLIELAESAVQ